MLLAAFVVLTAAAQTQVDLRTQAKSVDFTAATATKPVKTGTALPGSCTVGEMFFKTDAPAGANLYACTAANTWSLQGGISSQNCSYDSTAGTLKCSDANGDVFAAVKTSSGPTLNQWVDYISPAGVAHTSQPTAAAVGALADSGANGVPYRSGMGTASPANADQLSAVFSCQDTGAINAYACNLAPPISAYTQGTTYWFQANTANTGSVTINFNGLGAKQVLKQGSQQLDPGDIKVGQWVMVTYGGLAMQMQSQSGNPPSGSVASVFGRTGLVAAHAGDYTTAQVIESGNLYFTNTRAQGAFSFPGVVTFLAGALDCPTCVTTSTQADTDLYGTFPHLSVVKLQGRQVSTAQPADQQYLGWNNVARQWEPKTLPASPVTSIYGRSGAVAAQNGDYAFSQISGTLAPSQLPATAMRTDGNNTVTAGTEDMSGAAHTLPMKSGLTAALPATCQVGEAYFATDAPAGNNVYGCTAANTWSAQGANLTVASDGTVVGSRSKANFTTGPGLLSLMSDTGSEIDILWALDTSVVETQPGEQTGRALLCASATGSPVTYQCSLTPTLGAYLAGMTLHWKPDVNGTGGPTTLNIDTLGAVPLRLRDGVSDPAATDIVGGELYDTWYDGTQFRLMTPLPSTASGSVLSVFGRQGAVVPRVGDYTTDQVTEGGNLYYTNARALAAVTWAALTGKPSAFTPSPHAASHQNGGSDEIATATPAANAIPKAGADGKLASGWLPAGSGSLGYTAENVANKGQANGYAPLDSSAHVPAANTPALTGDVTKAAGSGATTVAGIQGRAVASTAPADGQALVWNASGSQYVPASLATGNGTSSTNGTNGQPLTSNGSGGFGTPLTLVTTIGSQGADTSIPSEKAVRSAMPTLRTWNYVFQGVDYGGVPVFAGNIPATSAPAAKLNASGDLAVLDFPAAQSTYYWYGSWRMPPAYPANGVISYTIFSMCDPANCDSTHAANVYISLACSGTTARPDSPSYTELTAPLAITNNASGYQTVTSGTITPGAGTQTLPACAAANRATIKLRVDTTGMTPGDDFQLSAVSFYVQGQI
jgi:hypothetical protein